LKDITDSMQSALGNSTCTQLGYTSALHT